MKKTKKSFQNDEKGPRKWRENLAGKFRVSFVFDFPQFLNWKFSNELGDAGIVY